jgi:hypothetical protein
MASKFSFQVGLRVLAVRLEGGGKWGNLLLLGLRFEYPGTIKIKTDIRLSSAPQHLLLGRGRHTSDFPDRSPAIRFLAPITSTLRIPISIISHIPKYLSVY